MMTGCRGAREEPADGIKAIHSSLKVALIETCLEGARAAAMRKCELKI